MPELQFPGQILKKKRQNGKRIITVVVILILIGLFFFLYFQKPVAKLPTRACFTDKLCVNLELALTVEQQKTGLMNRASLPEDTGMLFVYDSMNLKKFWMKDTLIPLDIIWLNDKNEIIFIAQNAQPCTEDPCDVYGSDQLSKDVLEVNGGFTEKNGILVGDFIVLR